MPEASHARILPRVTYQDVEAAVAYLCATFGFSEDPADRYHDDTGSLVLTELTVVDARIMVGRQGNHGQTSPLDVQGRNTQMLVIYVDDVDGHYNQAIEQGAQIEMAINNAPWGDRRYEVLDPEGHRWGFHQRL